MEDRFADVQPYKNWEKSTNKSWCPIPWVTCSTSTNGHYRLCVQANSHRNTRGLFYDKNGTPYKATTHSISEVRNAELVKEVRQSMLKREFHPACVRCHEEESNKLISRRVLARFNHEYYYKTISLEKATKLTHSDGSIEHNDFPVKDVDLRMGNRCNLKCRSCYPGESSGWYEEWYDTYSKKFRSSDEDVFLNKSTSGNVVSNSNSLDWAKDSKLIPNLFNDCPELMLLAIVGGEPLLIREHFKALEAFVENDRAKDIIVDYNTNLTQLPTRALELWKDFGEVMVGYSIDGVGKVNDYIRHPSKWQNIEANLRNLDSAEGNYIIWPTVTIMAYNVFYIPEIIKWQIEFKLKKLDRSSMLLFFVQHPLRNPPELSAQILPMEVKETVALKYKQFKESWFEKYIQTNLDLKEQKYWRDRVEYLFSSILNQLFAEDKSDLLPQFFKRTRIMDEYRNENFSESLPELYEMLKEYDTNICP